MKKITEGWVLCFDGKYWGELYSDGHSSSYGYTDDIDKISITHRAEKPPIKTWFTYEGSPYTEQMLKGEWVRVKIVKSLEVDSAD